MIFFGVPSYHPLTFSEWFGYVLLYYTTVATPLGIILLLIYAFSKNKKKRKDLLKVGRFLVCAPVVFVFYVILLVVIIPWFTLNF